MFIHVVFIGILAFGYSTFVRGETNYTYYDDRIDSVRISLEGNLDSGCVSETGVYLYEIQLTKSEELPDDIAFPEKGWGYITCLALKRKLISTTDGWMHEQNMKNLRNDMTTFDYVDENIINKVITDCPNRHSYAVSINPSWTPLERAKMQMMFLVRCMYKTMKEFNINPSRGDFGTRERFIEKAKERTKKAVKMILFKTPQIPTYTREDKENYNNLINSAQFVLENNLYENCTRVLPYRIRGTRFVRYNVTTNAITFTRSHGNYLMCLNRKKEVLTANGFMDSHNVQNLQRALTSVGLLPESVIDEIISCCPNTGKYHRMIASNIPIRTTDRSYYPLVDLSECIFKKINKFYEKLAEDASQPTIEYGPFARNAILTESMVKASKALDIILSKH